MMEILKSELPVAEKIESVFTEFVKRATSGGIVLIVVTIIAMIWANSPFKESYFGLWHLPFTISLGEFVITKELHHWINDGLMATFFFLVGLEIKRESMVGELASFQKAMLPIVGAIGGVIMPALIYTALNFDGSGANGWAIPVATDIAFALGVLALLGDKAPIELKIFLTALAIVDDIGAVLIIAVFYTADLSTDALFIAFALAGLMYMMNKMGVKNALLYLIVGFGLWFFFLKSGVHATIAGVIGAFTIPPRSKISKNSFEEKIQKAWNKYTNFNDKRDDSSLNEDQMNAIHTINNSSHNIQSPLHKLEHGMHPWVAFVVMPIFALANAGIYLGDMYFGAFINPITFGIILGLFFGKQIGITLFVWLSVKMGITSLPEGISIKQIYAVSALCGIGFTMSLFVSGLAFGIGGEQEMYSKIGILTASIFSGALGFYLLSRNSK